MQKTMELCQLLLERQSAFEQQVTTKLHRIQCYLDDLLVYTHTPFQPVPRASTPEFVQQDFSEVPPSSTSPSPLPETSKAIPSEPDQRTSPCKVSPTKLSFIRANSCSRENFASKLVKELFTVEERSTSNVKGVLGKEKLDENKIKYIQKITFENYPCSSLEHQKCWAKCVKAIDSASRNLCRKLKTT